MKIHSYFKKRLIHPLSVSTRSSSRSLTLPSPGTSAPLTFDALTDPSSQDREHLPCLLPVEVDESKQYLGSRSPPKRALLAPTPCIPGQYQVRTPPSSAPLSHPNPPLSLEPPTSSLYRPSSQSLSILDSPNAFHPTLFSPPGPPNPPLWNALKI